MNKTTNTMDNKHQTNRPTKRKSSSLNENNTPSTATSTTTITNNNNPSRQKRQLATRARHRLLSIDRDSKHLKQRVLSSLQQQQQRLPVIADNVTDAATNTENNNYRTTTSTTNCTTTAITNAATAKPLIDDIIRKNSNKWPWLPNKQCGSWYLPPTTTTTTPTTNTTNDSESTTTTIPSSKSSFKSKEVYFKSTDGHVGTYAISLKRLNLSLLEVLHQSSTDDGGGGGGCFLVDSSVRKILPDSFSRTIPIWCCVMNRLVLKYRRELLGVDANNDANSSIPNGADVHVNGVDFDEEDDHWDIELHTPASIITPEEHTKISNLIDSRVELLYQSKAIVDPKRLVHIMTKPVRAVWVTNGSVQRDTTISSSSISSSSSSDAGKFFTIVCCNPSYYNEGSSSKNHIHWVNYVNNNSDGSGSSIGNHGLDVPSTISDSNSNNNDSSPKGYYYTPGAADDDATWGRNLTHELFWTNREKLLDPSLTEDEVDARIDSILEEWQLRQQQGGDIIGDSQSTTTIANNNADQISNLNLWIGSRRAGRPPECWDNFDAILNVTENEYPSMIQSMKERQEQYSLEKEPCCYYLQLSVAEGKKDKTELERWMPIGLVFLMEHLQHRKRRVLVHCAQGRDRSVGIVLAFVALTCTRVFPLRFREEFDSLDVGSIANFADEVDTGINGDDTNEAKDSSDLHHLQSGLSISLVKILSKENGRDVFLKWMHEQQNTPSNVPFVNKESLRIVLHLVSQDRENAEPTRSTMQKLNRFFMSSPIYRPIK